MKEDLGDDQEADQPVAQQLQLTGENQVKFERGAELLKHLQEGRSFDEYWLPIGEGLLAVRKHVMTVLCLVKASGGQYKRMFGRMCHETPYADMPSAERSHLLYCMEHEHDLTELRVGWTPSERASINHPTVIARYAGQFLKRPIGDHPIEVPPRRNASPIAVLKDKNIELARTIEDLNESLASAEQHNSLSENSLFDDAAEDIANAIITNVGIEKAKIIYQQLGLVLAAREPLSNVTHSGLMAVLPRH